VAVLQKKSAFLGSLRLFSLVAKVKASAIARLRLFSLTFSQKNPTMRAELRRGGVARQRPTRNGWPTGETSFQTMRTDSIDPFTKTASPPGDSQRQTVPTGVFCQSNPSRREIPPAFTETQVEREAGRRLSPQGMAAAAASKIPLDPSRSHS
jgi:hypothetical protein